MDDNNTKTARYTLVPCTTPLNSQDPQSSKDSNKSLKQTPKPAEKIRAINEDDDGYDPYSDYQEKPHLFEKDPWR